MTRPPAAVASPGTPLTLADIRAAYAAGADPAEVVEAAYRRIAAVADPGIFIHIADIAETVAAARALGPRDGRPLWGIPFAVKDNIDVAGMPTTVACPAFAYRPERDAFVVARLRAAGAIPIGKTNLDQFATGLVGVRTPHPPPRNAVDRAIVPGGSSSGSAVAVAHGIVPFALGTDTAGSGRVPAALNNVVGLKPSLGSLSSTGVVPACRTLDTVSVFALAVPEAYEVFAVAAGYDAADPWSRQVRVAPPAAPPAPVIGVPDARSLRVDDAAQAQSFADAVDALAASGARIVPIDFAPFHSVAAMLYDGAWVAERHAAIEATLAADPGAVHPVVRQIVLRAQALSATDAFRDIYRLAALRREAEAALGAVDALLVPTMPGFVTLAEVAADPLGPNARLGTYTNFVNLLDLCGLAVPVAPRIDGRPGGVTLLAAHGRDGTLAALADRLPRPHALGATGAAVPAVAPRAAAATVDEVELAVCGAHMSGLPLNRELTARGGRMLRATTTTPDYRLYALPGPSPRRPGLVRVASGGAAVAVEVWALPLREVGGFLAGIPAPLGLGTTRLADGTAPKGFLCEAVAADGAEDVTRFGGWRAYLAAGVTG